MGECIVIRFGSVIFRLIGRAIMRIIKEILRFIILIFTFLILLFTALLEWLGSEPSYQNWYTCNKGVLDLLPFKMNQFFKRIFNKKQLERHI